MDSMPDISEFWDEDELMYVVDRVEYPWSIISGKFMVGADGIERYISICFEQQELLEHVFGRRVYPADVPMAIDWATEAQLDELLPIMRDKIATLKVEFPEYF